MTKSDWKKCKLGDVCDLIGGFAFKSKSFGNFANKVIKIANIQPPCIDDKLEGVDLSNYNVENLKKYLINYNDFCLAMTGATIGKLGRYKFKLPAYLNQRVLTFRPNSEVDKDFLYHYLSLDSFQGFINNHIDSETAQPNISATSIGQFELLLPPLEEQKRIAQILGALDDKIELLQKQNKTLEDMAKAIFKSWFVDFDVVHAKQKGLPKADIMREYHLTDELYDLFPSDFENSSLGPIPSGWQVKTLGDISTCYDSKRIPLSNRERAERQGNYPYYGATSIMDHVDDFLFDGIHLLLGEDGSVVKPEGTPFLQYVFGKIWVNNHAHVLQGKAPVSTEFLYLFLSDVQIQPYVTGAVQAKLNQKNMNSIPVCMATEDFVRQFQGIIEIYFVKIRSNLKQIQTLTELRDTLLPALISGKIRV